MTVQTFVVDYFMTSVIYVIAYYVGKHAGRKEQRASDEFWLKVYDQKIPENVAKIIRDLNL